MVELKSENNSVEYDNLIACVFIITTPRFNKLGLFRLGKYNNPEDAKLLKINAKEIKLDDQFITYRHLCSDPLIDFIYKQLYTIFKHFTPVDDELNNKSLEVFDLINSKEWFIFDYEDLKTIIIKACSLEGSLSNNLSSMIKTLSDIRKKHEDDIINMI